MTAAVLVAATEVSTAFAVVRIAAVVVYEDAVEKETVEKGSEDADVAPAYATRLDAGASAMSWLRLNGTNGFNTLAQSQQPPLWLAKNVSGISNSPVDDMSNTVVEDDVWLDNLSIIHKGTAALCHSEGQIRTLESGWSGDVAQLR